MKKQLPQTPPKSIFSEGLSGGQNSENSIEILDQIGILDCVSHAIKAAAKEDVNSD